MNSLVIVGAGGHGEVIADIAEKVGYSNILFLDDTPNGNLYSGHKIVGKCSDALHYKNSDFIVAIGNAHIRRKIQSEFIALGLNIVTLVHPSAVIAPSVKIGIGTVIMAAAVINPYAEIGNGCIINTCASVDHDCKIGDFSHISVGSHLAGTVTIGENTWIGVGATVSNNINIADECMIGAGAVVIADITVPGTYIGVPAKMLKSNNVS